MTKKEKVKKSKTVKHSPSNKSKKPKAVKAEKKEEDMPEVEEDYEPKKGKKEILTKQKIDDVVGAVSGEHGIKVIEYLGDKKNVSEFVIAEKLNLDMQTIRNTLYKLHTHHIATYIRKKDRQKGWYISYWTFNRPRIRELIDIMKRQQIEKLKERLEKEQQNKNVFFICQKACARLDFDQATEFEFKCPECGSLLQQQENSRTIEHLKERINELEQGSS
jgi:transcription initiation factor TFIIE subunit alpha